MIETCNIIYMYKQQSCEISIYLYLTFIAGKVSFLVSACPWFFLRYDWRLLPRTLWKFIDFFSFFIFIIFFIVFVIFRFLSKPKTLIKIHVQASTVMVPSCPRPLLPLHLDLHHLPPNHPQLLSNHFEFQIPFPRNELK